jgi:hypothetical protein
MVRIDGHDQAAAKTSVTIFGTVTQMEIVVSFDGVKGRLPWACPIHDHGKHAFGVWCDLSLLLAGRFCLLWQLPSEQRHRGDDGRRRPAIGLWHLLRTSSRQ